MIGHARFWLERACLVAGVVRRMRWKGREGRPCRRRAERRRFRSGNGERWFGWRLGDTDDGWRRSDDRWRPRNHGWRRGRGRRRRGGWSVGVHGRCAAAARAADGAVVLAR